MAFQRLECGSNVLCSPDFEWHDVDAKRASQSLNLAHLLHDLGIVGTGHAGAGAEKSREIETQVDAAIDAMIDSAYFEREARKAFGFASTTSGSTPDVEAERDAQGRLSHAVAALARAIEADR
jgi:hypothetical protein